MKYLLIIALAFSINACAQKDKTILERQHAEKELKSFLANTNQHNVISKKNLILEDKETAISVAEPILFKIYGKENIQSEKPYQAYLVNNYWVISGTLPDDSLGGTFLIILDAKNSQVIRITHGK